MRGPRRHRIEPTGEARQRPPPVVRFPTATVPSARRRPVRSFVLSGLFHWALFFALTYQFAINIPDEPTMGDDGRPGGGGGGGGRRVTLVAMSPLQSSAPTPQVTAPLPTPTVVPTAVREIREVTPVVTPVALQTLQRPLPLARVSGNQPGVLGGPGSGTGTGGGVGSGTGTGVGSGTGPGSGGENGNVLPPTVRRSEIPPLPRPDAVKGMRFELTFFVSEEGRVLDVEISPDVPSRAYRRRWMDVLRRYRFRPAVRADGARVRGKALLTITL